MDQIWVMVDQEGAQTLFQLVEVGGAPDASRLVKELHLPVVMIDVTLPPAQQIEAKSAPGSGSARAKLVVVNVHTGNEGEVARLGPHPNVERGPVVTPLPLVS